MALDATVYELVEAGLLKDAAAAVDNCRHEIPTPLRVLRSQLEFHVGSPNQARLSSERLLKTRLSDAEQSICWETIGRVAFRLGDIEEGQKAFKRGFTATASATDLRLEARVRASFAEAVLHCIGIEPATVEIPTLRRLAVHTADAYSMIALHLLVAEIHTKTGSLVGAKASITTARALLSQFGNLLLQGRLEIVTSVVAILESDYISALAHTTRALECATRSGSQQLRMPALGNFVHIKLAQDRLQETKEALAELKQRKGGGMELGILGTEMEVALAAGDLAAAESINDQLSPLSSNLENGHSYYGLWCSLTQVKWLFRIGQAETGVEVALESIPHIKRTADRNLLERMQLLAAEGLGRTGRISEGSSLLAQAVNANPDPPLEMIAEASRVAGRLTAHDDPGAAVGHFERAASILEKIGNLTGRADVQRDAIESLRMPWSASLASTENVARETASVRRPSDHRPSAAPYTERHWAYDPTAVVPMQSPGRRSRYSPGSLTRAFSMIQSHHAAHPPAPSGCQSFLECWPPVRNGPPQPLDRREP